jgi:E3 ubiquitin-protein ligase ZNF598
MADQASAGPRNSNPGGGGRRRGGGGGRGAHISNRADHHRNDEHREGNAGHSRGRGGRRGRGHEGSDRNHPRAPPPPPDSGGSDGTGTSGDHPTGDAITGKGEAAVGKQLVAAATDEPDDGEVCFICASKVVHTSVAPCNHRTCHICALRLRVLYKTKACAHCRVSQPVDSLHFVVLTVLS